MDPRQAILAAPATAEAWYRWAIVCMTTARAREAHRSLRRARRCEPTDAALHARAADLLARAYALTDAATAARVALILDPGEATAAAVLANACLTAGETDRSIPLFRRAIARDPNRLSLRHEHLASLRQSAGAAGPQIARAVAAMPRAIFGANVAARAHAVDGRDSVRRLRVGHVLGPFAVAHTHTMIFLPTIEAYDRTAVDVVCYAHVPSDRQDRFTRRYRAAAAFHDVSGMNADAFAARVAEDRIDILCDCYGLADPAHLEAFTRRAAPLQMRLDLVGTSGLPTMDYLLADPAMIDAALVGDASERRVIVPCAYLFRPLGRVQVELSRRSGPVVFGSFNQLSKISPAALDCWAEILSHVPGARLLIKARPFRVADVRRLWQAHFERRGVSAERLDLRPWTADAGDHLRTYAEIDVALDSFPYAGATTTCEALLLGTPVVSLRGDTVFGRYGASLLRATGFEQWVARDHRGYVDVAVALARGIDTLREQRSARARQAAASPLCDGRPRARALERAFRQMWQRRCASLPPIDIDATREDP
jgi:predicted O-linked N-acetylglucosamine transferase (SPINDLY family)